MSEIRIYHREALESLDLESWLSQYTAVRNAGGGERRIQQCPRCGDDRWKLYVNVEKRLWLCYVCDWGRKPVEGGATDVVELMAAISGRGETEIRIELATMVVPAPAGDITTELANAFAEPVISNDIVKSAVAVEVPGSTNFDALSVRLVHSYALRRGLSRRQVQELGLHAAYSLPTKRASVPGPWLVFPVRVAGMAVAWQGRRVNYDGDVKYLSSSDIHDWLWPLDGSFFAHYRPGGKVVLVEGVFDAQGFLRYRVPALASFGKTVTDRQIAILRELQPSEVIVFWDADVYKDRRTARATMKAIDRLAFAFADASVVDTARADGRKVDPGNALSDPGVVPWLVEKVRSRMNVRSQEFWQWKLTKLTT